MLGVTKMFGCMLILRRISAADVSANEAQAKMHPLVSRLQAFLATACVRLDILNLV